MLQSKMLQSKMTGSTFELWSPAWAILPDITLHWTKPQLTHTLQVSPPPRNNLSQ